MDLLVVGSVALDTIETPSGRADEALGGSASHFACAAACFARVGLVGVVGRDFPKAHIELLASRGIDTAGLEVADGRTFRWTGRYGPTLNQRTTLSVELNVFGDFKPRIPAAFKGCRYVFLANGGPETQASVLDQVERPAFVLADTMDLWINNQRPALMKLLARVDGLVLNDEEAKLLTGREGLPAAARAIVQMGPKVVIVKKGEHGAMLVCGERVFILPAFPLETVLDPTGAGDSFAGGLMGYLASTGDSSFDGLKAAMVYGTVTASFNVEAFGLDRTIRLDRAQIDERRRAFLGMVAAG